MASRKLFIGNLPPTISQNDLIEIFAPYGEVVECDIVKNYAFLHYSKPESAVEAAGCVNGLKYEGYEIRVEVSRSRLHTTPGSAGRAKTERKGSTKLFVGNITPNANTVELKKMFETYGKVIECDIVRDFAFIHYEHPGEAETAAEMLNGAEFEGVIISVERSHSKVRQESGMDNADNCFKCGRMGHWSRNCTFNEGGGRSRAMYGPPIPHAVPDPYDHYAAPAEVDYYDSYYRYPYRPHYAPSPPGYYGRERLSPLPERYREYVDPYERSPYPSSSMRDPYERPPPDYYERAEPRDPYEDHYRYAMRTRETMPRRRAPPPY